jgi:hypothetical protein
LDDQTEAAKTSHISQTKRWYRQPNERWEEIKCDISYETCEENSMLITHFVNGLLVYNIHVSENLADVELFSFIKTYCYWVMQRHTTRQNRYCNLYRWK